MTDTLPFLAGGGEAARMIAERDWSDHPLGPPEIWPESLRTALSLVLNSPESMILAWGPDLHFFFNDTYFPLLGPRLSWAMGERFDRVWADGWEQAKPIIDDAFAGRSRRFEDLPWKLDTDRGEAETWWTFSYSRVLDGEGRIAGLFIFTNETTKRVRAEASRHEAEAALRAERDRAQGVLANMGEAFALLGHDFRILDLNAEALRMEGRPWEEVVGRIHWEAHPGTDPELDRLLRKAMTERVPVALEHRYTWPGGRPAWIDMRAYPVPEGLAVFYRDATARREAEEASRRSEAFLAATLERLPVGVIIAGADGRILRDNPANREIWGVPPETLSWEQYGAWVGYWPETGQRLRAEEWGMARALLQGETVRGELIEIERFDGGGRRLFLNNAAPIRDDAGTIVGGVVAELDVTERVEVERRLRESEALARANAERVQLALTAGAIIGTWFWDLPTDRFSVDEAFARAFGLDPSLGRDGLSLAQVVETVHPDDKAGLAEAIAEVIARGGAYAHQYRVRRADGRYYWIEANGRVDHAADGTPLRFPGVLIDVEERRAVEAERDRAIALMREKAVEFETLADNIPALCWMARADGHIYWYNRRWYDYTGTDAESMQGWGWEAVHDPVTLPSVVARWRHSLATGERFEMTFPLRGRDGVFRPFLTRIVPIRDAAGAVVRWFGTNTDVTDLRAAQDALRRLNETLEEQIAARTAERDQIWQVSSDLLAVASFEGRFLSLNPAWSATLGWSEAELKATPFIDFVHPDDRKQTLATLADLACGHTRLGFENRCRTRAGTYLWFSWNAVPREGLVYASVRDVTAVKEQARALAEAEEALRQSQKMEAVGQLTGGLAHDFNNLLAGISGSLELMQTRISQGRLKDVDRYMSAAQGAAKRAAALTHRLLAFSRRQTLDPKPTDVNRLVMGLEELIRRTVGPTITIEVVGAAGLWPILVDPPQLENALLNLCINARDAMPEGGRITIETANKWLDDRGARERDLDPGQYLSLCVTDTGTGMSPEVRAKAFDPFFTTKPIGQGTGLGLSMIYGFAKQSGGQVRIYSEIGEGTTVCIYLPRYYGEAEEPDAFGPLVDAPRAERGETVLVVDDEPTVRMLVTEVLEDLGYTAIEAADSASGLKVLQSDVRIDLLITDVGLPGGMNGRQMADAARVSRPDLKILFITGYAENAAVGNGHLEPGMAVLTKPFVVETLGLRIREMIARG
ncbi:PAS domain S-box protein [Methylorubrum zatmanii]